MAGPARPNASDEVKVFLIFYHNLHVVMLELTVVMTMLTEFFNMEI